MVSVPMPIALFGEAEKGDFHKGYLCENLTQLAENFGNPPLHSRGLFYAVQALLYQRKLIFFRVKEEGFSRLDYFKGIDCLKSLTLVPGICAICMPGVGNGEIIEAAIPLCKNHHSLLIISESDFYDYMTHA